MTPELVICGNLIIDDIVYPDGRARIGEAGGAVLYAALGARLWGPSVGVVAVRGFDYPHGALDALRDRGVALDGIREMAGPNLRTWLLYEEAGRRVIHQLGRPTHLEVSPTPDDVPEAWSAPKAYHLSPMPFEAQVRLVEALSPRRDSALSLDPHERLREDNLPRWRPVLANLDAFFPSEDDLALEGCGPEDDPRAALKRLAGGRLRFIAFKRSRRGGMLYDARAGAYTEWPPVPRLTGEGTGAGDAFAGGFLAGMIAGRPVEDALDMAIVSASFALEDWGAAGLLAATHEQAMARLRDWLDNREIE
jgi:sugar/nucleoside kinase (ribokinase family)